MPARSVVSWEFLDPVLLPSPRFALGYEWTPLDWHRAS